MLSLKNCVILVSLFYTSIIIIGRRRRVCLTGEVRDGAAPQGTIYLFACSLSDFTAMPEEPKKFNPHAGIRSSITGVNYQMLPKASMEI